ncbi:MAG TPA: L-threonylcarbamoyladenylate synthase [Candidatus Binatia bacterium]|nr:L-threonylcarbamoyladenylate synthase [Candidatus Binatia bacterium]
MRDSLNSAIVDDAVDALRRGGVIVYPTETLYGLGADATNPSALAKLLALKVHRDGKPISVLVSERAMLDVVAARVAPIAEHLIERFWPGPLTLVVEARADVSDELTAGSGTIGVRWSSHPIASALVARLNRPITAPSANPSGAAPATTIAEARAYFGDRIEVYVDAGTCSVGAGSTIVDATGATPRILREGAIPSRTIAAALAEAA